MSEGVTSRLPDGAEAAGDREVARRRLARLDKSLEEGRVDDIAAENWAHKEKINNGVSIRFSSGSILQTK